jgi:hypothetical protein
MWLGFAMNLKVYRRVESTLSLPWPVSFLHNKNVKKDDIKKLTIVNLKLLTILFTMLITLIIELTFVSLSSNQLKLFIMVS